MTSRSSKSKPAASRDAASIEAARLELQIELDARKTQRRRNQLGQFATPPALAESVVRVGVDALGGESIRFLDPAVGSGSFFSALTRLFGERVERAVGVEVDEDFAAGAAALWSNAGLGVTRADFTEQEPPADEAARFNLVVCNPPYVRHHHLTRETKQALVKKAEQATGIKMSALSGLYCHFLMLSHAWMTEGGIGIWLIPSEFMTVNYGAAIRRYLTERVELLGVHRFDPDEVQFDDALVSSAVVLFRKNPPKSDAAARMSYGGSLERPRVVAEVELQTLRDEPKWTRFPGEVAALRPEGGPVLSDFFDVRRGLATGDNSFFVLAEDELAQRGIPRAAVRPILPSPRYVKVEHIKADPEGVPINVERLFLLDLSCDEEELREKHPSVWSYLQEGKERGVADRYLCANRKPWYKQEKRMGAPFMCTYLGRPKEGARPFRFILNESVATAANTYLMLYPKPEYAEALSGTRGRLIATWEALNRTCPDTMLSGGRVYGGGLHKLEPKELAALPADEIAALAGQGRRLEQQTLFA